MIIYIAVVPSQALQLSSVYYAVFFFLCFLLITRADVTIATSLENGAAIPVPVHFRPKSVTGEEIFSSMKDSIKTVQTCENCLKGQRSVKHIVTSKALRT